MGVEESGSEEGAVQTVAYLQLLCSPSCCCCCAVLVLVVVVVVVIVKVS